MEASDHPADAFETVGDDLCGVLGGQASCIDQCADGGRVELDVGAAGLREFFDFCVDNLTQSWKLHSKGVVLCGQGGRHHLEWADYGRLCYPAGKGVFPFESVRVSEAVGRIDVANYGYAAQVVVVKPVRFGELLDHHPGEAARHVDDEGVGEVLAAGPF